MMRVASVGPPLLGGVLLLIGWGALAAVLRGGHLIAGPAEVAGWITANPGLLGRALGKTLTNATLGFLVGNLVAMALAGVAMIWPRLLNLISGLALVVFCLPLIATGPILRVLMGPGDGPQIVLAALAVYYTTLIPLLTGLRATPAVWLDLVHSYGRGRWSELIHVRARTALPYLFAGLQIAAPAAFLGAMVGEFTGAEQGMGVLTIRFMRALDVPALWAIAVAAAAVSMVVYGAIGAVARMVLHDRPPVILSPPRGKPASGLSRLSQPALLIAAVLVLWWAGMALPGMNPFFAKSPQDVLAALTTAPQAAATRDTLWTALTETAVFLLPGYVAGLMLGAGLAIALVLVPNLSTLVMPIAVALRSVPIVTTAPLIVLFLGRGALGTISLVAAMVFFPTLVACLHGMRQAPGQILDVFHIYAAGRLRQMVHIRVPAMLPAFFAAARMSVPAAILAVTVVEWLTTGRGLGSLMALSASVSDYNMLWAAVAVVTTISALCYAGVAVIERRILSVYAPEQVRP
ncbi:ABC transporter permease subunit [Paracoccus sp. Z330]|uniref:ABC transporter permease subunit n=2 Tax=Paracoccus onchidii TaxID=3017813 RepID=A0ABT4ZFL3_9RHOB|nr:ABC transporter permease subunit [Paracoccus onchidii]MDB6177758.1 ABC transporter permease subunit [Paracoccus onchidii]